MTTNGLKRDMRIKSLHQQALKGKYTHGGKFSMTELFNDALAMGVHPRTAQSYANAVVERLKKGGHLK